MDSSSSSSPSSLVSRARTALHSAASRAEKVLTDIKADLKNDRGRGDGQSHKSVGKGGAEERPVASAGADITGKASEEGQQEFKHSKWKPVSLGKKQDWHNSLKMLRIGKKDVEEEKLEKAPLDNFVSADGLQQMQGDLLVIKLCGILECDPGRQKKC